MNHIIFSVNEKKNIVDLLFNTFKYSLIIHNEKGKEINV